MDKINKFGLRIIFIMAFAIYFILIVLLIKNEFIMKEGFNTYFRQTVRPQIRNIKDMGRALGLF
jgi:hypothetical protein